MIDWHIHKKSQHVNFEKCLIKGLHFLQQSIIIQKGFFSLKFCGSLIHFLLLITGRVIMSMSNFFPTKTNYSFLFCALLVRTAPLSQSTYRAKIALIPLILNLKWKSEWVRKKSSLPKTLQPKFITLYDIFIGALKYVHTLEYRSKSVIQKSCCFVAFYKSLFFVSNSICLYILLVTNNGLNNLNQTVLKEKMWR